MICQRRTIEEVFDHCFSRTSSTRIPVHMIDIITKLLNVRRRLLKEYGREPKAKEIGDDVGMSPEKLRAIIKLAQVPVPFATNVSSKGDIKQDDFTEDISLPTFKNTMYEQVVREEINEAVATLEYREQEILRLRFGLIDGRTYTLEEVGKRFHLTRERIRQIEAKALRKLRHPSRSRRLKYYLE
jgi:RNA polymerase primary sigma factor